MVIHTTNREAQVIDLMLAGLSDQQIADRLDITAHTVAKHIQNVRERNGFKTRLALALATQPTKREARA